MLTKGSVLVVDDEVNLCRILGAKLARSGYDVVTVHDGAQAVEKIRESDFDVVLLDLILPKMDGLRALAEIRGMRDALPVIVMTACESAEALEQAKTYGVAAYVNKPFDLDSLVSLVTNTSQAKSAHNGRRLPESTVLFASNQPVTIEIANGGGPRTYTTGIVDKDDRTLTVLAPRNDRGFVHVAPRSNVRIGISARDAHYSFTTQVSRVDESEAPVLVLEKPSVVYRVQRREHPRHAFRIPLQYSLCGDNDSDDAPLADGETRDISLGGALINVPTEVPRGEIIHIELRPKSDEDRISATAQVLRTRPADEPGDSGFYLGCRFVIADPSLRKLLRD